MFSKLAIATVAAFSLLAAATPLPGGASAQSCSTGAVQCCNAVQSASDPATSVLLGLIGVVVQDVDVAVGITCSPITVIGVGAGGSCSAETVCCQDNSYGGLVSLGCAPISL